MHVCVFNFKLIGKTVYDLLNAGDLRHVSAVMGPINHIFDKVFISELEFGIRDLKYFTNTLCRGPNQNSYWND